MGRYGPSRVKHGPSLADGISAEYGRQWGIEDERMPFIPPGPDRMTLIGLKNCARIPYPLCNFLELES